MRNETVKGDNQPAAVLLISTFLNSSIYTKWPHQAASRSILAFAVCLPLSHLSTTSALSVNSREHAAVAFKFLYASYHDKDNLAEQWKLS